MTSVNFYRGNDSNNWISGASGFQRVVMDNVYPGITLKLENRNGLVEKVFHVASAADPYQIKVKISGGNLEIDSEGALIINTSQGDLILSAPYAYQKIDVQEKEVKVGYQILTPNCYGFVVGDYDHEHELIIDPVLFSTFLGGSEGDVINSITLDSSDGRFCSPFQFRFEYSEIRCVYGRDWRR
jgi:hypothetical protein